MTTLHFISSIFNATRARTAFQTIRKFVCQLCVVNTLVVFTTLYWTAQQQIDQSSTHTYLRNDNVSGDSNGYKDAPDFHAVLQKDTLIIREGYLLMRQSDCYTCHADTKVMTAPSYMEIAEKYKNEKNVEPRLVNKVIEGGKGQWGNDRAMTPHPELLREDAQKMITYILQVKIKNVK